jgi:hypothetical protein
VCRQKTKELYNFIEVIYMAIPINIDDLINRRQAYKEQIIDILKIKPLSLTELAKAMGHI